MKIQSVSLVNYTNYQNRKACSVEKSVAYSNPTDSVHFTAYNYGKALKDITSAHLERESTVESYFKILMSNIFSDNQIEKTPELFLLDKVYKNKGLRGMLLELCQAHPSDNFKEIIDKLDKNPILTIGLLKLEGLLNVVGANVGCTVKEPVIKLINYGRQGFWNNILDRKDALRDIRLSFVNRDESTWCSLSDKITFKEEKPIERFSVELSLDKKADVTSDQRNKHFSIINIFHSLTGHKKLNITAYEEGKPEYTYYNKNGTKAFWKNFFNGGVPVEPIY